MNLVKDTDSYKGSHWLQYPPRTTSMFSYLESRGGKYTHTVFFGLQYYLKTYLQGCVVTVDQVNEAKEFFEKHGEPFNYDGWMYIAKDLKGKLPIRINAVPEGLVVPTHNVLMTVESTDPKVFWIVSWLETLLMRIWYPITVATVSYHIKQLAKSYLERTHDNLTDLDFYLHDFGSRGVSSQESAAIGGAAHLVNFLGSDTLAGVDCANSLYGTRVGMAGYSIPAAEHSTMTMWGRDREVDAYRNMIRQYGKPGSIFAVVSDSYDLYNAIENIWGKELKTEVLNCGATLVIRPDSGHPATVVLKALQLLEQQFGASYNTKMFKLINSVRVIQGDGVNEESIREVLETMKDNGYSAANVKFGMGGALLQQVNRDILKFAFKCSSAVVDGKEIDVYKDPVTDPGKRSKRGKLNLVYLGGQYRTTNDMNSIGTVLKTVFENGEIKKSYTLDEVRHNSNMNFAL